MTGEPGKPDDLVASSADRDDLYRQQKRFRQWFAELAASVADTEERIAATFERMAMNMNRSNGDTTRLRAKAARAREYAAQELNLIAEHDEPWESGSSGHTDLRRSPGH